MNKIPSLTDYQDWFEKAKHDYKILNKSNEIFDLVDCLLSLNALPEWVSKSDHATERLKNLANEKIMVMKGIKFKLDTSKIGRDIDHQLRFIRIFCNHSKHGDGNNTPIIVKEPGNTLPATLPVEFITIIKIGDLRFNAKHIIYNVIDFWNKNINE